MRIVLFDTILETHVVDSLERALVALGHEVQVTGKVWQGFHPPTAPDKVAKINRVIERIIDWQPDAVVAMRSSTLTAPMIERLQSFGIVTACWFSDDPVLFNTTGKVAPLYDFTLHTGDSRTLALYKQHRATHGVTFPFWCDEIDFPPSYAPEHAAHDVVFLGHMHNFVKQWRFDWLQEAVASGVDVIAYGKTPDGASAPFARGELAADEVAAALPEFRFGLSFSQQFADYAGTEFDYPGLAELGEFPIPSRVVQFACIGLPTITMRMPDDLGPLWEGMFPELLEVRSPGELADLVAGLRHDPAELQRLSTALRARWQRDFSAATRAALLVDLLANPSAISKLSVAERSRLFIDYQQSFPAPSRAQRRARMLKQQTAYAARTARRRAGRIKRLVVRQP